MIASTDNSGYSLSENLFFKSLFIKVSVSELPVLMIGNFNNMPSVCVIFWFTEINKVSTLADCAKAFEAKIKKIKRRRIFFIAKDSYKFRTYS
jgi:hypothetical protein